MKPEPKEDDGALMDLVDDANLAEPEEPPAPAMDTEAIVLELRALLDQLEAKVGLGE